jgi:hypothetical protein
MTHLPEGETAGHHRLSTGANAPAMFMCRQCYWPRQAVAMQVGAIKRGVRRLPNAASSDVCETL